MSISLQLSLVLKTFYPYRRETTPHPDALKSIVLILGQTLIQKSSSSANLREHLRFAISNNTYDI